MSASGLLRLLAAAQRLWQPWQPPAWWQKELESQPALEHWRERVRILRSAPDNARIRRARGAGRFTADTQTLHNGLRVAVDCYYGALGTLLLMANGGVHEPQEELVFGQIVKLLPRGALMVELGSYWAAYSMAFQLLVPAARCYLVDPDAANLDAGRQNFALNAMKGKFFRAAMGSRSWLREDLETLSVDDFVRREGIEHIDLLHADIQGAELEMLCGSRRAIEQGRIRFFFVSTHSNALHRACLAFLTAHSYSIVAAADMDESYSYDGLIVAQAPHYPPLTLPIAKRERPLATVEHVPSGYDSTATPLTMISYAQAGEDVLLARAFAGQATGFYIDVGAGDPVVLSVTKHFYDTHWRGINVEPSEAFHDRLCADRPADINLRVALSDREGITTYFAVEGSPELSTLSATQAEVLGAEGFAHRPVSVAATTLARICEQHVSGPIDFLKIDVEGHERQVIAGGDWSRFRPRVVVVEDLPHGAPERTHPQWELSLLHCGYRFASMDALNRFYVRLDQQQLWERLRQPVDAYIRYDEVEQYESALHRLRRLASHGAPA